MLSQTLTDVAGKWAECGNAGQGRPAGLTGISSANVHRKPPTGPNYLAFSKLSRYCASFYAWGKRPPRIRQFANAETGSLGVPRNTPSFTQTRQIFLPSSLVLLVQIHRRHRNTRPVDRPVCQGAASWVSSEASGYSQLLVTTSFKVNKNKQRMLTR